jgi:hypothetical protein
VKLLRILQTGSSRRGAANEAEKLAQISTQLTNVLSKRVAGLTIVLIVVMPLFLIPLYPEADFSMQVWTESLARRVQDSAGRSPEVARAEFDAALKSLALFYASRPYGPYEVCVEDDSSILSGCYQPPETPFVSPIRGSFQLVVSEGPVVAYFDFGAPLRAEANMGMALVSSVLVILLSGCLLLNYVASELAVRPLERMLASIKRSARSIFSSVSALGSKADEEDFGEELDSEVRLLERVVGKIATLAELSSKKTPFDEANLKGMKSEELGVLALAAQVAQAHTNSRLTRDEVLNEIGEQNRKEVTVTMQWQLEEIGVPYEVLNSWDFNVLELNERSQEQISAWLLMNYPGSCAYTEVNVESQKMRNFIALVSKGYLENTYHNFMHAVDVTHTVFRYMLLMRADLLFTMLEQFSMLVASICHDLGHIGVNNAYLTEVQHELAIRYNDRSPLENMHCVRLFEILAQPGVNVFLSTTAIQFQEVRKSIIDVILHTDITAHNPMVKELELLHEMNSKVFESNVHRSNAEGDLSEQEVELLKTAENKKLIQKVILHGADTANPTKPWYIAEAWAYLVLDEYANQGDEEKKTGYSCADAERSRQGESTKLADRLH